MKELQETSMGENSEAIEEFFLGMTVDEVCAFLFLFLSLKVKLSKIILKQELLMNSQ